MRKLRVLLAVMIPCLFVLGASPQTANSFPPSVAPTAPEALPLDAQVGACEPASNADGKWVYISDLSWKSAQSGWQAVADVVLPERDVSFSRNPLILPGGATFGKGLGTYPFSEVRYDLAGQYSAFKADLGLNDDAPAGATAVFLVYADGALVFNSGVVAAGTAPLPLDVCLAGVRELRLVTAYAGKRADPFDQPPPSGSFANWVDSQLFQPKNLATVSDEAGRTRAAVDAVAKARWDGAVGELGALRAIGEGERQIAAASLGLLGAPDEQWPAKVQSYRAADGRLVLANKHLIVSLGLGGSAHGLLTVVDTKTGLPLLKRAGSAIGTGDEPIDLTQDTEPVGPDSFSFEPVQDAVLGTGTLTRARLRLKDSGAQVEVRVALYDDHPYFTYQVALPGPLQGGGAAKQTAGPHPTRFEYLSAADADVTFGDQAHYFADGSYARSGDVSDDALWRNVRLDIGKPAFVWGNARPGGLVMSLLDEQRLPAFLVMRRDAGRAAGVVGITQPLPSPGLPGGPPQDLPVGAAPLEGPRLLIENTSTSDLRDALSDYRTITNALYPPVPMPDWVRYQWGSWYVYGSGVTEDDLRSQIDLISRYLGDLGPWHILIDAGWQDLGPGASGDLGKANAEKFPDGLRSVVDYAHSKGIKVLLFYSAVYVHDGNGKGEWLGMPGLVQQHPDWFIRLTPEGVQPARFLLNYSQPEARAYLISVLTKYVTEYDADGIKIDGLGDVEGQLIPLDERVSYLPDRWSLTPVMDVYRVAAEALRAVKPDAFIESGWINPAPAQGLAQTFRFGDESNKFNYDYPFPGLMQHFDYGAVQEGVLGQRANIGAVFGGFNRPIADEWLGAALALGAHVSYGNDFNFLSPQAYEILRPWLVQYRPFQGTTHIGGDDGGLHPNWAATTVGDQTFLALVNHTNQTQTLAAPLAEAGLDAGQPYLAYSVMEKQALRVQGQLAATVPAQSLKLYVVRRQPGVVWTASSFDAQPMPNGLTITARGPRDVHGDMLIYWPGAAPHVLLDGASLGELAGNAAQGAHYDAATGLLHLRYSHGGGPGDTPAAPFPTRTITLTY